MNNIIDLETLSVIANVFQVLNYTENLKQTDNNKIMEELERQNKEYLNQIIKQNELIINMLGGAKSGFDESEKT